MEAAEKVEAAFKELGFTAESKQVADQIMAYEIAVDPDEDIYLTGMLVTEEEESDFRLLAFVDELDQEKALDQLKAVMGLNGELPAGAYCMDPFEDIIYATVNIRFAEFSAAKLASAVELLLFAQNVYDQEFYPTKEDAKA